MGDMLTALASGAPGAANREKAASEARRWRRDITFRRSIGVSFSWTMARRNLLGQKERSLYAPTLGGLRSAYSQILFRGDVDLDQIRPKSPPTPARPRPASRPPRIRITRRPRSGRISAVFEHAAYDAMVGFVAPTPARPAPAARKAAQPPRPPAGQPPRPDDPPALRRRIRDPEDSNKGRFGGKAQRDGFRLSVSFDEVRGRWVYMTLSVTAPDGATESYVDQAVFLHDSFDADRLQAVFRNGRASVPVVSYGGFTVGAWLPSRQIELELDLAEVPEAPRPIQIY
jgi:hypothetical protein